MLTELAERIAADTRRHFDEVAAALDDKVEALGGKVEALDGKVEALGGKVGALDGKVAALDGGVAALDGKVDALPGQVTVTAKETRRHFEVVAEDLRHDLQGLAEGIEGLDSRADARTDAFRVELKQEIGEVRTLVTASYRELDRRLTRLEEPR
jgi:hypothetical protein